MGVARGGMHVVPKQTYVGYVAAFQDMYPHAKVLYPDDQAFTRANRAEMMNRIATGDWDAVVITDSQMKRLPLSAEAQMMFLRQEVEHFREAHIALIEAGADRRSQKQVENLVERLQKQLGDLAARLAAKQDEGLTFESLGIDQLFVDEAHVVKNLRFSTSMSGVKGLGSAANGKGSDIAWDMFQKVRYLQQNGKGIVFATGTPITNTIAELWTMMRYLQPRYLEEHGWQNFDAWARTFGATETDIEQTAHGSFKPVERFVRFDNLAELNRGWQETADIRVGTETPEMDELKPMLIELDGAGNRTIVKADPDQAYSDYMQAIAYRAEHMASQEPSVDNFLLLSNDAAKASLDMRLIDPKAPPNPRGKVAIVAANVYDFYLSSMKDKGTTLIFTDMGIPRKGDVAEVDVDNPLEIPPETLEEARDSTSLFGWLRQALVDKGIPRDEIAFINEAKTSAQRKALEKKVNLGIVRVLIGTNKKMGVGLNLQARLGQEHFLTVGWRPDEVEQPEGRLLRPGNIVYGPVVDANGNVISQGKGVQIFRYIQEGAQGSASFDGVKWQAIQKKALGIKAVFRRDVTARSVEDVSRDSLGAGMAKAMASGNPLQMELNTLEMQAQKLTMEQANFWRSQDRTRMNLTTLPKQIATYKQRLETANGDVVLAAKAPDPFAITISGREYHEPAQAAAALIAAVKAIGKESEEIGRYNGFALLGFRHQARYLGEPVAYHLSLRNPSTPTGHSYSTEAVRESNLTAGLLTRLRNVFESDLKKKGLVNQLNQQIARTEKELAEYQRIAGGIFAGQPRLDSLYQRINQLREQLQGKGLSDEPVTIVGEEPVIVSVAHEAVVEPVEGIAKPTSEEVQGLHIAAPAQAIADTLPADKPNAARGETALKRLSKEGFDEEAARDALDDYKGIERGDYPGDPEGFRDARQEAWDTFKEEIATSEKLEEPSGAPGLGLPGAAGPAEGPTPDLPLGVRGGLVSEPAGAGVPPPGAGPAAGGGPPLEPPREPPVDLLPPEPLPEPPERVTSGFEERGFTERERTVPGLVSDHLRAIMGEPQNREFYEGLSNIEAFNQAAARVAEDSVAARARVMDLNREADPITVAENILLLKRADEARNEAEAQALSVALARYGTPRGQEIQLYAAIQKFSPAGIRLEAVKAIERYKEAHGGVVTPALRKQLRHAEEAAVAAAARKEAQQVIDEAAEQLQELRQAKRALEDQLDLVQGVPPGRTRVSRFMAEMKDLFADELGAARVNPFVRPEATLEDQLWRARAEAVKAIADPEERKAAARAFMKDLELEAKKAPVPLRQPPRRAIEEEPDTPERTRWEQGLFEYLTDDRVRTVRPRMETASHEAAVQVKGIFDRAGREMSDDAADSFIRQVTELDEVPPELRRQAIIDLVLEEEALLPVSRQALPVQVTQEWLETQSRRIEQLVNPEARQTFAKLHSTEALAWGRLQELGRRTGVSISEERALQFAADARQLKDLRHLPLEEQVSAVDSLVNQIKQESPLREALEARRALMDAHATERRAARQVAHDLRRMTEPYTPQNPTPAMNAAERQAINAVVRLLDGAGVRLSIEQAKAIRLLAADLNGLTGTEMRKAVKVLVAEVKQYDPVARALNMKAAKKAEEARLKKRIEDVDVLMGNLIPQARARAKNVEREVIGRARRAVVDNELALPQAVAENLAERARLAGELPPGAQQDRMREALLQDVKNLLPPSKWHKALQLYGISRASQIAWDASYPLRQGAKTMFAHPRVWASIWAPMFEVMRDPVAAARIMDDLATRPMANIAHWSGLEFVELGQPIMKGEEYFGNEILSGIPGYKGSERGFAIPGNLQRGRLFDHFVEGWFPEGTDFRAFQSFEEAIAATNGKTAHDFKNIAAAYNTLTGRGNVEWLKSNLRITVELVYATRWTVSKVEPWLMMVNPVPSAVPLAVRAELAKNLFSYYGLFASLIAVGVVAGLWESDGDPRSANFGKVRLEGSDTWHDLMLGAGPVMRFIARIVPTQRRDGSWGGTRKTASGEYIPMDAGEDIAQFVRGIAHPVPGTVADFIRGSDPAGRRRDITKLEDVGDALFRMVGPLSWHDIGEAVWEGGLKDGMITPHTVDEVAQSAVALVGGTVQSYITLRDIQNKVTAGGGFVDRAGNPVSSYAQLNAGQRRLVNDSAAVRAEVERIDGQRRVDSRQEMMVRFKVYDEGKEALEKDLRASIGEDWERLIGKNLAKKLRQFKQARFALANGMLSEAVLVEYHKGKDVMVEDAIAEKYWGIEPAEDPNTLELDFRTVKRQRETVLQEADALGVSRDYVKGKGPGTFRGKRFDDAVVRASVERYEADTETLEKYWDLADTVAVAMGPKVQDALDRYRRAGREEREAIDGEYDYRLYKRTLADERMWLRIRDTGVQEAGARWYEWEKPVTPGAPRPPVPPRRPLPPRRPGGLVGVR